MDTPISAEDIIARYASGERSFVDLELDRETLDLSNVTLAGADFSRSFIFATFRGADLSGAVFDDANVKTCDFTGANLAGASFLRAAIDGATFTGDLSDTTFDGAGWGGYTFLPGEKPYITPT